MQAMRRLMICFGLLLMAPSLAIARSSGKVLGYQRDHVWPTAVRFMVVDEHAKLVEKDADAGYMLFELRDDGKVYRGSLEMITVVADGRSNVRFAISIIDRPLWMEQGMIARLEQKLRGELGSPPPPPRDKHKDRAKDGDKDGEDGDKARDKAKAKDGTPEEREPPISRAP